MANQTSDIHERRKITIADIQLMKRENRKITMLSIPDYPLGLLADRAGIDMILVGDSLAMTVLGYEDTIPVTVEEMLYHTKAVTRAVRHCFVVADMPFMSYNVSERDAIINAGRFMKEGRADAVKVEGGANVEHIVKAIHRAAIPVVGHIGLTPQAISMLGGLKVQGSDAATAEKIIDDALLLEAAGAFLVILECVPASVAKIVTERLTVPTISYGAGIHCDGQGLVAHDIIGLFDRFTPKFVKRYVDLNELILEAFLSYKGDVVEGNFPTDKHSFHIKKDELEKIGKR